MRTREPQSRSVACEDAATSARVAKHARARGTDGWIVGGRGKRRGQERRRGEGGVTESQNTEAQTEINPTSACWAPSRPANRGPQSAALRGVWGVWGAVGGSAHGPAAPPDPRYLRFLSTSYRCTRHIAGCLHTFRC